MASATAAHDRVRDVDELDRERTQSQAIARLDHVQLGLVEQFVLFQTALDQRQRELRSVDRNIELREQKRNAADVILVPVRQDQRAHHVRNSAPDSEIGSDDIDAQQFGVGEHHARVDYDNVVSIAECHGVHPELP